MLRYCNLERWERWVAYGVEAGLFRQLYEVPARCCQWPFELAPLAFLSVRDGAASGGEGRFGLRASGARDFRGGWYDLYLTLSVSFPSFLLEVDFPQTNKMTPLSGSQFFIGKFPKALPTH